MKKSLLCAVLTISCAFLMSCGNNSTSNQTSDNSSATGSFLTTELVGSLTYEYVLHHTDGSETGVVRYDDLSTMLLGLDRGDIGAIPMSKSVVDYIASTQGADKYTIETTDLIEQYSLGVGDAYVDLLPACNEAILAMQEDGTLASLQEEYITKLVNGEEPSEVTFETVDGRDTLKVGVTGDLPPMDYVSADGTPMGFNTAFLAELGKRIDRNIELVNINSGSRAASLVSGKVDMVFWVLSMDLSNFTMPSLDDIDYITFNGSKLSPTDTIFTDTLFAIPEGIYISEYYFTDNTAILRLK